MNAIEGLKAVIEKDEIVPTRRAQDFLERPEEVHNTYHFHAQTYIPIQIVSDDSQTGVDGFAKRLITQVKNGRSPRGYIVGEFGYGKTSAGLYIWEQAVNANLIALPPFQLNKISDFIDATAGWVGYQLGRVSPQHQREAENIYRQYIHNNLEALANQYQNDIATLEQMYADGLLNLSLTGNRVLDFFRKMAALVQDAGFDGLVLMADEIQQYLTPQINEGVPDPLGALFDIVQGLADERQHLNFGFLLIMPTFQLGAINDQRGDLIDRMRDLTLDLKTIYDRHFPARLWKRYGQILGFEHIADHVIQSEMLDSLGQIASRSDLSNGPRTVVNVLKLATKRYLASPDSTPPYSPIDLIEAFISGAIQFDGTKKVQEAVTRALNHEFVRQDVTFTKAVKLAAAFPLDGATETIQAQFGLQEAFGELRASGFGDIVIEVGDRNQPGITLRGLDDVPVETDELTLRLRDFARHYKATSAITMKRAIEGFVALLQASIFQDRNWKPIHITSRADLFRTTEIVFTGAFPSMESRYPQRDIHVRIIHDIEEHHASQLKGECSLIFYLDRHDKKRNDYAASDFGSTSINDKDLIGYFSLNLELPAAEQVSRQLADQLTKVFASNQINPLLLLALYTYFTELRQKGLLSKPVAQIVEASLQRQILEGAVKVLFNPQLGDNLNANGVRIVEQVTVNLITTRYGDSYHTLITYQRWRDVIRNYIGALERLPRASQKRGLAPLEATKDEIASYFGLAITGLDNMLGRIPHFVRIPDGSLSSSKPRQFYFCLHPLETQIWEDLQHSETLYMQEGYNLHTLRQDNVVARCIALGYKIEEIDHILKIMQARDMIIVKNGNLIEKPRPQISLKEIRQDIEQFLTHTSQLEKSLQQPDTRNLHQQAQHFVQRIKALHQHDDDDILRLSEELDIAQQMLEAKLETMYQDFQKRIRSCLNSLPQVTTTLSDTSMVSRFEVGYASNLGIHRVQLQQDYKSIETSVAELGHRLNNLRQSKPDIAALSTYIRELKGYEVDVQTLTKRWTNYNRSVAGFRAWMNVAEQQSKVEIELQQMGSSGKRYLQQLAEIDYQIRQLFSDDFESALDQADHFHSRIKQLTNDAKNIQQNAKAQFDKLQSMYRRRLVQDTGIPENELWDSIIFSPLDPDGIYQQLNERVHRTIGSILDRINDTYERYLIEIKDAANNPSLRYFTPQLEQIYNQRDQVGDLRARIASMNTLDTLASFNRQTDKFDQFIRLIADLKTQVQQLGDSVWHLTSDTEVPQRTAAAEHVYQVLNRIQSTNNKDVDLLRLKQLLSEVEEQTLWEVLYELWHQRALEIRIRIRED